MDHEINDRQESAGLTEAERMQVAGRSFPLLTAVACAICVIVFLGLNQSSVRNSPELYDRWGVGRAHEIRSGAFWFLITSSFAHLEIWHLVFNLYWLWHFGAVLERALGRGRWLVLYLALAFVSSAAELTVSGETGIGASGVVYGFFGFMWASKSAVEAFRKVIDRRVVQLFIVWLWFCVIATFADFMQVGNAAHIAGLVFGFLLAHTMLLTRFRKPARIGAAILAVVCCIGLVWAPWTASWTTEKAIKAYDKEDFKSAEYWTRKSLENGEDKVWCWDMLARTAVSQRDRAAYTNALETLRTLDSARAAELDTEMQQFRDSAGHVEQPH